MKRYRVKFSHSTLGNAERLIQAQSAYEAIMVMVRTCLHLGGNPLPDLFVVTGDIVISVTREVM